MSIQREMSTRRVRDANIARARSSFQNFILGLNFNKDELNQLLDWLEARNAQYAYTLTRRIGKDPGRLAMDIAGAFILNFKYYSGPDSIYIGEQSKVIESLLSQIPVGDSNALEERKLRDKTRFDSFLALLQSNKGRYTKEELEGFISLFNPYDESSDGFMQEDELIMDPVCVYFRQIFSGRSPIYRFLTRDRQIQIFDDTVNVLFRALTSFKNDELRGYLAELNALAESLPSSRQPIELTLAQLADALSYAEAQVKKMRNAVEAIKPNADFDRVIRSEGASSVGYIGSTQNLLYLIMADYLTFKNAGLNSNEVGKTLMGFYDNIDMDIKKRGEWQSFPLGNQIIQIAVPPATPRQNHNSPFYGIVVRRFNNSAHDFCISNKNSATGTVVHMNQEQVHLLADFVFF